jgi:hypothetical protein
LQSIIIVIVLFLLIRFALILLLLLFFFYDLSFNVPFELLSLFSFDHDLGLA